MIVYLRSHLRCISEHLRSQVCLLFKWECTEVCGMSMEIATSSLATQLSVWGWAWAAIDQRVGKRSQIWSQGKQGQLRWDDHLYNGQMWGLAASSPGERWLPLHNCLLNCTPGTFLSYTGKEILGKTDASLSQSVWLNVVYLVYLFFLPKTHILSRPLLILLFLCFTS